MWFLNNFMMLATLICTGASQGLEQLPILKKSPALIWMFTEPPQPLSLPCSTLDFNPGVTYSWEKNGNTLNVKSNPNITSAGGTITISKPTEGDAGEYRCYAEWNLMVASSGIMVVMKTYLKTWLNIQRHRVFEGGTQRLHCPVHAAPAPDFEWKTTNLTHLEDVRGDHVVTPDGSLWLMNVTKDTQAITKYICLVSSPVVRTREVAAEHYIVMEKSNSSSRNLKELYVSADIEVHKGDDIKLYCIIESPTLNVTWLKNSRRLPNSMKGRVTVDDRRRGQVLVINDTRIEDEGTYTCVARNNASAPRRHHMEVTVVQAPIFVDAPQPVTVVRSGQEVTFTFIIEAKPDPLMIWTFNGQPLFEDSNGITLTVLYVDGEPTRGQMTIERVMGADSGYYGCMAYNKHGEVYAETLLHIVTRKSNVTQLIKK